MTVRTLHRSTCCAYLTRSEAFRCYHPVLYKEYQQVKDYYSREDGGGILHWNFSGSVYSATTVNFGPRTLTHDHVDSANFAPGWCRVRPYGKYDFRRGGHLVFWDLGIAVQFPAGTSIFSHLLSSSTPTSLLV